MRLKQIINGYKKYLIISFCFSLKKTVFGDEMFTCKLLIVLFCIWLNFVKCNQPPPKSTHEESRDMDDNERMAHVIIQLKELERAGMIDQLKEIVPEIFACRIEKWKEHEDGTFNLTKSGLTKEVRETVLAEETETTTRKRCGRNSNKNKVRSNDHVLAAETEKKAQKARKRLREHRKNNEPNHPHVFDYKQHQQHYNHHSKHTSIQSLQMDQDAQPQHHPSHSTHHMRNLHSAALQQQMASVQNVFAQGQHEDALTKNGVTTVTAVKLEIHAPAIPHPM